MKCPNCSYSNFTFYPDDHIAYFDQFLNSWAEAMVYTCPECGYSELTRSPQMAMEDRLAGIIPQNGTGLGSGQGGLARPQAPNRFGIGDFASHGLKNCSCKEAAIYAYNFCLQKNLDLDITLLAWALSLAEKSGISDITRHTRRMYLAKCRECRLYYFKRGSYAHKTEILGILDSEIERVATMEKSYWVMR